ncbi:retrovirus-related pol polyprotein from transposon TNT 1-94 [Tanacetum coccineum]|uniref:Retrovirus-related pol polyprotein from transposon TNT 1-94 n=1 Tax=Tanacetum coccineum TaxID=301880 RepID=A0ABQ4WM84_9ASTR
MSSIAKFDVKKFDGSNDFGLWRVKMRCLLIQHGWEAALDPFPGTMADAEKTAALKTNVYKKAHSTLLLCLDNKVLREVNKEDSVVGVWLKLETLYMTKSLANKLYLKKKLFTFYMHSESLTLEDVLSSLNSWELKKRTDAKDDGDGLYVRGRSDHRGNQGRGSSRSKSKGKGTYKLKCYICYYEYHLKKDSLKWNKKKSTGFVRKNAGQGSGMHSEGYDNGNLLMAVSEERFLEWIMDSSGSYHMTPIRDFLFDFKEFNGRVKVIKDSLMVLSKTMKGKELRKEIVSTPWMAGLNRSRRIWVHFLRHKNEAFSKFKEWKQLVENQTGRKLKKLQTDNGLEFCNQEFNNLCKESGIERYLTVTGTPQQNGLAERMNRTLLNMVRCLLFSLVCHRSPSTALEKKKPMNLWSGHAPNYEMLRIFGCGTYSHVNQGKLKPRAIKCIFLGYLGDVKGYRLWRLDDAKPKIIISRDAVFNESLMYKDTLKGAGAADSGKDVEFEVELQESRVKPTMDPHTGENPGNEERDEGNVSLSRPTVFREQDDMAAYAFSIAEEEDTHKPITFQKAINSSKKD